MSRSRAPVREARGATGRWRAAALCGLFGALSAACQPAPEATPTPGQIVATPAPEFARYDLDVVISPAPQECGPEAAITLAQTQSDLALAAVADLEQIRAATDDPVYIAAVGRAAFGAAYEIMAGYRVPDCLAQAHMEAVRFFDERRAGYAALSAGDVALFEQHLARGEAARQAMTAAINAVLNQ